MARLPENTIEVEIHEDGYHQIAPMNTHVLSVAVYGTKATLLHIAHSMWDCRQQLSIDMWLSKTPAGDLLYTVPPALQRFHPTGSPLVIGLYAADNDYLINNTDFGETLFGDMMLEGSKFEVVKNRKLGHGVIPLRLDPGTYYINIRNTTNRDNGYYISTDRVELREVSSVT